MAYIDGLPDSTGFAAGERPNSSIHPAGTVLFEHAQAPTAARLRSSRDSLVASAGRWASPPHPTHPLRAIDQLIETHLHQYRSRGAMRGRDPGSPLPVDCVIRAVLLQVLYSFECGQQFMEQLHYNLLYRWFVGLRDEHCAWDAEVYSQARKAVQSAPWHAQLLRELLKQACTIARRWPAHFRINEQLLNEWSDPAQTPAGAEVPPALAQHRAMLSAAGFHFVGAPRNRRLHKALILILQRLGETDLTPDALAGALCISRRALYLLFEKQGLTPTRAIQDVRLERCKQVLGDPRQQDRKITVIALQFGFKEPATFCRQFKRRYGLSPREYRSAALQSCKSTCSAAMRGSEPLSAAHG